VQSATPTQIVLKTDSGDNLTVNVEDTTAYLRIAPGETDLRKAEKINAADVAAGDRVLAQARPNADLTSAPAARIVVMSKAAIAQKHEADRAEWQRRGLAGTVTAINPAAKEITLALRGLGSQRLVIVNASGDVQFRRYAPDSVKFSDAKPSSFAELKIGDHVRVLGERNEDSTSMKAEQIVFGTFRNFPATVVAVNAAANEVRVNDLESKKQVTVKLIPDSQVKRMPEMMAKALAMRSRGAGMGGPGGQRPGGGGPGQWQGGARGGGPPGAAGGGPGGEAPGAQAGRPSFGAPGGGMGGGGGMRGGDPQQMLERMPAIAVTELKPGDAVIVASTAGADVSRATAIALIAGVEPILTAPREGSDNSFASWSLNNLNLDIAP
jgi:hypothetical protein